MSIVFNEEEKLVQETVRKFAEEKLIQVVDEMDKNDYWPDELFKELGEFGLLAPTVSEDFGGAGTSYKIQIIILEELAKVSPAFSLSVAAHSNLTLDNISRHGSVAQKNKFLPKLCNGEQIGCLGLTEPSTGSDALGMKANAELVGDYYILNGTKTFITNAPIADIGIIYCKTNQVNDKSIISAFIVDLKNTKGITKGKPMDKMGMRGSLTGELFFDNAKIPVGNLLGNKNQGRNILMSGLSSERAVLAGISLGIIKKVSKLSLNYSLQRKQFGKKLAEFQLIKEKLARMYVEAQTSNLLVYWAAEKIQINSKANKEAAASIYYSSIKATELSLEAIQIMGGYGYMKEFKVERFLRDAKLLEIGGGTTEIRKLIIANDIISKEDMEI